VKKITNLLLTSPAFIHPFILLLSQHTRRMLEAIYSNAQQKAYEATSTIKSNP